MKIGIIGAGAMGSLYGAKLSALTEHTVSLIDVNEAQIAAVNEKGLQMETNGKTITYDRLTGFLHAEEVGPCDLVILFVKSTLTKAAVTGNLAVFGPDTIVLTLQNGMGNVAAIREALPQAMVLAGTTAHGATMLAPGSIRHAGTGKTILGACSENGTKQAEQTAALFQQAGLETEISTNVEGLLWDKLLVNVGINALTGLTELRNGQLLEYDEISSLLCDAVKEGAAVAKAKGISLQFSDPVAHAMEVARATAANRSSMLQDLSSHRKTEIETINGAIVKEAASCGLTAPVNATLTRLIQFKERRIDGV